MPRTRCECSCSLLPCSSAHLDGPSPGQKAPRALGPYELHLDITREAAQALSCSEKDQLKRVWKQHPEHLNFSDVCLASARFLAGQRQSGAARETELRRRKPPLHEAVLHQVAAFEQELAGGVPDLTTAEALDSYIIQNNAVPCPRGRWSRARKCAVCGGRNLNIKWAAARSGSVFHYPRPGGGGTFTGRIGYKHCSDCGTRHDLQCYSPGRKWAEERGLDPVRASVCVLRPAASSRYGGTRDNVCTC